MIIAKIIHKLRRITHTEKWLQLLQKSGYSAEKKKSLNHRGG